MHKQAVVRRLMLTHASARLATSPPVIIDYYVEAGEHLLFLRSNAITQL